MPDDWEEQKRRAQSPFHNDPDQWDAIKQATQKAHEDIEKLRERLSLERPEDIEKLTTRFFLQRKDEIDIKRQELAEDIKRLHPEYINTSTLSKEERESIRREKADWRDEIWQDPYKIRRISIDERLIYGDEGDHAFAINYNEFFSREERRIRGILKSNGLTEEEIERQNRILDPDYDLKKFLELDPKDAYSKLINEAEAELGKQHPFLAYPLTGLGYCKSSGFSWDDDRAAWNYKEAIRIYEKQPTENHHIVSPLHNLGVIYHRQERYEEAVPLFERVIQIEEKFGGESSKRIIYPLEYLAHIYDHQGRKEESEALHQRASALAEEHGFHPAWKNRSGFYFDKIIFKEQEDPKEVYKLYQHTLREARNLSPKPEQEQQPSREIDLEPEI